MKAETGKFHEIFVGIQKLIETDGLRPGDRLPSERELSERLRAGRSTVREVLRSLELLGLISTRRGEGTYLESYHAHHLVHLLAGFILRDAGSRKDLSEMRILLESGAVRMALRKSGPRIARELRAKLQTLKKTVQSGEFPASAVRDFHMSLIRLADNYLLTRTWVPLTHFEEAAMPRIWDAQEIARRLDLYGRLVEAMEASEEEKAVRILEEVLAAEGQDAGNGVARTVSAVLGTPSPSGKNNDG
ncbi:FadR/GntR family transcriptional regulator [Staphylospora marina]|uniref:FadR/GntR family transcriptional regulator n=1 Tax=Staphylospora marina TaxID=2490858 RepID=UPI000F5BB9E7|nr:FCD domain-containing protein [Staphylospora marina]